MKNRFLTVSIPVILLIIVSFYITVQFIQPAPKKELTIAAGSLHGDYYKTALKYKELLAKQKVKVNILVTNGSLDNINLLHENKADIAFIQNGAITKEQTNHISAIASVYYEPLWIFYKNEKYTMDYIIQLIGKKIAVGKEGSGTKDLSMQILNDNGINNENSQLLNYSSKEAKELLLKNEIDALFTVTSHDSQIVKELLENPNINLFSFKRARAYSRKYTYLESLKLYEGTLDLYRNLPDSNINLLSTTANIVARNEVPPELIRLFLKEIKTLHNKKTLFSKEDEFPNLHNLKVYINEEAQKYFENGDTFLEKIFPYWIASNIDRLKILLIPLLTLMIPLFKGVLPLYQWSMRSKIYKWYDELKHFDEKIDTLQKDELEKELQQIYKLQTEIKKETKVPLSFMGEYYNLIMHLDLIIRKINDRLKLL